MMYRRTAVANDQLGLSLVELMVGLVIGMLTVLVIMQVFATFEGQKRSTTGSADAQTNGGIALFSIQRDLQMAGYGLSIFDTQNPPLKCDPSPTVDHDNNGLTPEIGIFPLNIVDGGAAAGASDTISIRYSQDDGSSKGGIASKIIGIAGTDISVDNNLGCNNKDVVIISSGSACSMNLVNDPNLAGHSRDIIVKTTAGAIGSSITCIGKWNQIQYRVVNSQLQRNIASVVTAIPLISDIVNIQAQYGVTATANDNKITNWVDPTGTWAAPSVSDRNRIKAVHVAIVARNGLLEKEDVTSGCTTAKGTVNKGPCAWDDATLNAAPAIDLSDNPDWKRYRYRVYDTIIPLRNMVWSKDTL